MQLSPEDLSLCRTNEDKTCFQGIQQITSKQYLPSVEEPLSALREWSAQSQNVYISPEGMVKESVDTHPGDTTFVFLQDAQPNELKSDILKRHDAIIAEVTKELKSKYSNVLFIYTAKHKTEVHGARHVRQVDSAKPVAPSVPEVASVNVTKPVAKTPVHHQSPPAHRQNEVNEAELPPQEVFFNRTQLLLYFHNLTLNGALVETNEINIAELRTDEFSVSIGTGSSVFAFNVSGISKGYWNVDGYLFAGEPVHLRQEPVAALSGFSFHCTPVLSFVSKTGEDIHLHWRGLQIEPYFGTEPHVFQGFSDSWDCVGFTSAGIWGGLFVTLLFLIILSIGFSWMMDIRTMDRFDDPKGKTIIINTSE